MKILCVDDEKIVLGFIVSICNQLPDTEETHGFSDPYDALEWVKDNPVDTALLDIDMPELNGIQLAVKLKEIEPDINIIFLTGYSEYALDAFEVHAQGYLLKPVNKERLEKEISLLNQKTVSQMPHVFARTFGDFDVCVDGTPVAFSRSKSKELLAYLVNKSGAFVSRASAFAALYEDKPYDRSMQKQFDVIIRSLKDTLEENGISEIFEMKSGKMRVCPESFECDLYCLLKGDSRAVNAYRGVYMEEYPWAMLTESYIENSVNYTH